VPIGRPISGTQAYVLDERQERTGPGVAGELYVGGAGLARGYLKRPALTAERFVPDPFSAAPGARLYKTGDLARWRTDGAEAGSLEFLGRRDTQVKVRGHRIELGEIEAHLQQHPAVQAACVVVAPVVLPDGTPDQRVIAYLVPQPDATLDVEAVRGWLQERAPHYLTPSVFKALPALPLTPNGKVDRQALGQQPAAAELHRATARRPPRTPEEATVAHIWAEGLGVPDLSIDDDFFALGGHSLLATQMALRISREMGVELSLRQFFDTPTVAGIAQQIVTQQALHIAADDLEAIFDELDQLSPAELEALLKQDMTPFDDQP
jgi:acyl carrier protein